MADKENIKSKSAVPDHSHKFHRQRMRNQFYETGFKGMADHNVLEMLLYFGIPQKNTNGIAHDLIEKFGSYADVLDANRLDLMKVKGMTETAACLIKMIIPAYSRYVRRLNERGPSPVDPKAVADYLRPMYYEGSCRERVFALCYDSSDHLITCRMINEGDICSSAFDIRELGRIVLETNCSSVIISHNHPHSISHPSKDDMLLTRTVIQFLEMLKVTLKDHIIVSDTDFTSMANFRRSLPLFYGIDCLEEVAREKNLD